MASRPFLWSLALLLCGLGIAYQGGVVQHRDEHQRQREAVRVALEPVRGALSRELFAAFQLTEGISGLVAVEGGISDEKFRAFAAELLRRSDLIHNVGVAPGNVVKFVFPLEGNERIVGLDYEKTPEQWPSIARMMNEERTIVSGPVALVQGGVGVIARTPIYVHEQSQGSLSQGRYWGLTSTVLELDRLLERTPLSAMRASLTIGLRGAEGLGSRGEVFWGEAEAFGASPVLVDVPLPSGSWQIAATPLGGFPVFHAFTSPSFLAGSGLSLLLAALLFRILSSGEARKHEVRERRRAEAALTRSNRALRLFSQVKGAVVQAKDEASLLSEVCRISVQSAGYRMACIGRFEGEQEPFTLLAFAGQDDPRLLHDALSAGAVRTAIRTSAPAVARSTEPRHPTDGHDVAATIAVPLHVEGESFAVLSVCAFEPEAFADTEIELLDDLGSTLSHGIAALRAQKDRLTAIAALERAREELEERVAARTHELRLARDAAESADRLKSAFLATMSHELRTPLNAIIGFTGLLVQGLAGPVNEEQTKQLNIVYGSAKHLLALINDVLDLSKIEASQLHVSLRSFEVLTLVEKTFATVRMQGERKGLILELVIATDLGTIESDVRRVEQVLLNLLSNAIKFTERGTVRLEVTRAEDRLLVHVSDTGPGIQQEELDRLFKPFSQIDSGLDRRHEGTGLGLSICKRLVELLGGAIWVKSEWGQGSTFGFELPIDGRRER